MNKNEARRMRGRNILSRALVLVAFATSALVSPSMADQIQAILDRLDARGTGPESAPAPTSTPTPTATPKERPRAQTTAEPASLSNVSARKSGRTKIDPKSKVFRPGDKLPRGIAGQFLAGEFYVLGEYIDGGSVLYAVKDEGKTLMRQYVVINRTSGLPPATYYEQGRRPRVVFSREQPLVFVKKLFPGLYAVQVP